MPLYFAYGSNMDLAAMRARCPASRPIGPARLLRHRFYVAEEGYASVARSPRGVVWGLLFNLGLADMPALDRYESVARHLYGKAILPVLTASGPRRALLYIARAARPGTPRPGYMESVLAAAEAAGLPEDYRRELAACLPAGAASGAQAPEVRRRFAAPSNARS